MLKKTIFITMLLFVNCLYGGSLQSDKKFGIELNPFYLMISTLGEGNELVLSATGSYFDHKNGVEIAIPISHMRFSTDGLKQQTIDIHYRKFLNQEIGSLYLSLFSRLAKLEGETRYDQKYNYAKQLKVGVGAGIGFRVFSKFGLYWGASINLGRYLTDDNKNFSIDSFAITDDAPYIFDIEFFKFGYYF